MSKPRYRLHSDGSYSRVSAQVVPISDGLVSMSTRLGTSDDKAQSVSYTPRQLTDAQLEEAFRASWIIKKTVRVPALDATRKWRQWRGENADDIHAVEVMPRIQLRRHVYEALWLSRLYGGAAILIGTNVTDLEQPLNTERESLEYLSTLARPHLTIPTLDDDAISERFGLPTEFTVNTKTGLRKIHPSRIVRFIGDPVPPFSASVGTSYGWGDSILQGIYDACKNLDSTMSNIAALVFDVKTDVVKIPGLTENITNSKFETALINRFQTARMMKGNHGTLILDAEEEYDSKSYNFGGLDTIADRFMQVASGAADIPMTRLLGMSPAGMNSTGESDLLNYYDRIASMQQTEIAPEMVLLDELIVRKAGKDPEKEGFIWGSLRQLTEQQKSESRHRAAQTVKLLVESQIYDEEQIAKMAHVLFKDLDVDAPDEPGDIPPPPAPLPTNPSSVGRPGPGPNTGDLN